MMIKLDWQNSFSLIAAGLLLMSAACEEKEQSAAMKQKNIELHNGEQVEVVDVIKGDELIVKKNGQAFELRMLGIQAFSKVLPKKEVTELANLAIEHLKKTAQGKQVSLQFDTPQKDVYGRFLAYVYLDGKDLNKQLIEQGLAMVYTEFPFKHEKAYLQAEKNAQAERKNIWQHDSLRTLAQGLRKQWEKARNRREKSDFRDPMLHPDDAQSDGASE